MRKVLTLSVAVLFAGVLGACEQQPTTPDASPNVSSSQSSVSQVVNVTAIHEHDGEGADEHKFEIDRTELASGWTTFRFHNEAHATHFMFLNRLPEEAGDITLDEYTEVVVEPFQEFLDLLLAGDENPGKAFAETPGWFFDPGLTSVGSPGLTAPGQTATTTVKLEPGRYVVDCYVRDEDDVFHATDGMVEMLTVTEESAGTSEPTADIELSVSSDDGIQIESIPRPHPARHRSILPRREYTVAVHFEDQSTYENLVHHDVHLARLHKNASREELGAWMNWIAPDGLQAPAPEGVEFIGGTQDAPAGETVYFTATFTEGRHAFVAEVPDPKAKGMLKTISVPLWQFGGN